MNFLRNKRMVLRSQHGWVYVDALIGMVILAVAMTAILLAYSRATSSASYSKSYNQAVLLAQSRMERIYNKEPIHLTDLQSFKEPLTEELDEIQYEIETEFYFVNEAQYPNLYLCTVTVKWKEPTVARDTVESITLKSYYKIVE